MNEQEFWRRLEFRVCAELAGLADPRLRYHWCDGLVPEAYNLTSAEPHIDGVAYMGRRRQASQRRWQFTLLVGQHVASADQIDWSGLLPDDHLTGWLIPDVEGKALRIDPGAGYDR